MIFSKFSLRTGGVSLFELLIVLLFMAIVFEFGLPLTADWYQEQLSWVMQKDIEQAIEQGMQQSLILDEPLHLVPLHEQNWSLGVALIREQDVFPPDMIYAWPWRESAYQVSWHGFLSNRYLRFTPNMDQAAMNGYFFLKNHRDHGVKLIVNRVGRVRSITV